VGTVPDTNVGLGAHGGGSAFMMQPMSCNESEPEAVVERDVELPADPTTVWDELPGILGEEVELEPEPGGRLHVRDTGHEFVGVVQEAVPGERLSFRWVRVDGDDPPSDVEITLAPAGAGTILHLRETRLDGARLVRSAFLASARA
jgi:uncharacterized protein YndB with AHSA1/START domain